MNVYSVSPKQSLSPELMVHVQGQDVGNSTQPHWTPLNGFLLHSEAFS